jgi:hypothetical protein
MIPLNPGEKTKISFCIFIEILLILSDWRSPRSLGSGVMDRSAPTRR